MNVETQLEQTAARVTGTTTVPPELLTLLMDLLAGFMDSCLGNDPAALAKRAKNPSAFTIARLKREARKMAAKNRCADPVGTAKDAVTTLLTFTSETPESELAAAIEAGREDFPSWI